MAVPFQPFGEEIFTVAQRTAYECIAHPGRISASTVFQGGTGPGPAAWAKQEKRSDGREKEGNSQPGLND